MASSLLKSVCETEMYISTLMKKQPFQQSTVARVFVIGRSVFEEKWMIRSASDPVVHYVYLFCEKEFRSTR